MVVPEPGDKAFVERVRHEIDEARRRVSEIVRLRRDLGMTGHPVAAVSRPRTP